MLQDYKEPCAMPCAPNSRPNPHLLYRRNMITATTKLGGTATNIVVAKVAVSLTYYGGSITEWLTSDDVRQHGLMSMTCVF